MDFLIFFAILVACAAGTMLPVPLSLILAIINVLVIIQVVMWH